MTPEDEVGRYKVLLDTARCFGRAMNLNSLIDEILGLDATILTKLEARLTLLGAEIATARRLKKYLAGNTSPAMPAFLQRSL